MGLLKAYRVERNAATADAFARGVEVVVDGVTYLDVPEIAQELTHVRGYDIEIVGVDGDGLILSTGVWRPMSPSKEAAQELAANLNAFFEGFVHVDADGDAQYVHAQVYENNDAGEFE